MYFKLSVMVLLSGSAVALFLVFASSSYYSGLFFLCFLNICYMLGIKYEKFQSYFEVWASLVAQMVRNLPAMLETGSSPELGRSSGEGNVYPLQNSYLKNPHGHRSLTGYSPLGHKESDTTDRLSPYFTFWGLEWYYLSLKRICICFYNANKGLWILALRPTRYQDASKLSFNPCESLSILSSFVSSFYSVWSFRVSNKCLGYLPRTGYQLKGGKNPQNEIIPKSSSLLWVSFFWIFVSLHWTIRSSTLIFFMFQCF